MKRKLGRKPNHRKQMLKNLAINILLYEKITTTQAKAKEVKPIIDKAINIAKTNNLKTRRQLLSLFLHNKNVVNKLLDDISPRFKDIHSGYIKMFNYKPRLGDNAPRIIIILSKSKFLKNLPTQDKIKNTINTKKKIKQ